MKALSKLFLVMMSVFSLLLLTVVGPTTAIAAKAEKKSKPAKVEGMETWSKPNAAFDAGKMGDMTGWDPAN